jgi:hypothetical protein
MIPGFLLTIQFPETIPQKPKELTRRPTGVAESALDFVGNTPLVELSRLKKALELPEEITLMAKVEAFSAGEGRMRITVILTAY